MLVYHYHSETREFIGASYADPDPLELQLAQDAAAAPALAAFATLPAEERTPAAWEQALALAAEARQSVEPTIWLIPANTTPESPPATRDDEIAVWTTAGAWAVQVVLEADPPEEPEAPDPAGAARADRDARIADVRWLVDRHRDELALGLTTTLTSEDYLLVLTYIQALRDVPEQESFPDAIDWPQLAPELLADA